jgi:hypothetical protein
MIKNIKIELHDLVSVRLVDWFNELDYLHRNIKNTFIRICTQDNQNM